MRDPARLAALRSTRLLDTPAEAAYDRLTRLAMNLLNAPVAQVSLIDEDRQFFKSAQGMDEPWASARETPLSHSICQHAVDARVPLVIEDARVHPVVRDNLAIRDLNVVAYAGIPLITAAGHALGTLCVIDHKPRAWTGSRSRRSRPSPPRCSPRSSSARPGSRATSSQALSQAGSGRPRRTRFGFASTASAALRSGCSTVSATASAARISPAPTR